MQLCYYLIPNAYPICTVYTVVHKKCTTFIFWTASWNIGRF